MDRVRILEPGPCLSLTQDRVQDLQNRMVVKRLPGFDLISDRADDEQENEEETQDESDIVTDNLGEIGR